MYDLQQQVEDLERQCENLSEDLHCKEAECEGLQEEIRLHKEKFQNYRRKLEKLENDLSVCQQEKTQVAEIAKKERLSMTALAQENSRLKQELGDNLDKFQKEIDFLRNCAPSEEAVRSTALYADLANELSEKDAIMSQLKGELEVEKQRTEEHLRHLKVLEKKLTQAESECRDLAEKNSKQVEEHKKQSVFWSREKEQLVQSLSKTQVELQKEKGLKTGGLESSKLLEDKLNSRNEKLTQLEKKVTTTGLSVNKLEDQLREKVKAIAGLEKELIEAQNEAAEARNKMTTLKQQLKSSERKCLKLSKEVEQVRQVEKHLLTNFGNQSLVTMM